MRMEGEKETRVAVPLVAVKMKREKIKMISRLGRKRMASRRRDLTARRTRTIVEVIVIQAGKEKLEIKGEAFLREKTGIGTDQRTGIDQGTGHVIGIEGKNICC